MKYKLLAVILLVMLITTANGLQVEVTPTPVKPNDTFTITITLDKPTVLGIIIPLNGIKLLNCSAKYEIKDNKLMMVAVNDSVKCTFLNVNTTIVRCEWIDFVNEMKGNKTIYLKPAKIPTTPTPTPTIHGPTPVPTIYPTTPVLTTTKETPGFELALAIIALIYVLRRWYNR